MRFTYCTLFDEQMSAYTYGICCVQYLLNIQVLSLVLSCSSDLHTRKYVGNLFHKTGPDTSKHRSSIVLLFVFGITRRLHALDIIGFSLTI